MPPTLVGTTPFLGLSEKLDATFRVLDGKDTPRLGTIISARIFQGAIPVTFGVLFARWNLTVLSLFADVLIIA